MSVLKNPLYQNTANDIKVWISDEDIKNKDLWLLLDKEKFSHQKEYELGCYLWCQSLGGVFSRLDKISDITSRSVYGRRLDEDKGAFLKEWMVYNYHIYTIVFQSILEVALLLTNEVLELGNQRCDFNRIYSNKNVIRFGIDKPLLEIQKSTAKHREAKNKLVHTGRGTAPPFKGKATSFNITSIAKQLGKSKESTIRLLTEFLAVKNKEELATTMIDEQKEIEPKVEQLLDKLLPQYQRLHSQYQT